MNPKDKLEPWKSTHRRITNTRDLVSAIPEYGLILGEGGGRGIREQERAGQYEVQYADQIPVDFIVNTEEIAALGCDTPDDFLRLLGFTLGPVTPDDPIFRSATLPAGWTKRRTDHPLYTDLLDADGVKRGTIGYKAAFYDRWARLTVERPYLREEKVKP